MKSCMSMFQMIQVCYNTSKYVDNMRYKIDTTEIHDFTQEINNIPYRFYANEVTKVAPVTKLYEFTLFKKF